MRRRRTKKPRLRVLWMGQAESRSDEEKMRELLTHLSVFVLDPVHEEYGNFVYPDDDDPSLYRFSGNFCDRAFNFCVEMSPEHPMFDEVSEAIRSNQTTLAYAAAKREMIERDRLSREEREARIEKDKQEAIARLRAMAG